MGGRVPRHRSAGADPHPGDPDAAPTCRGTISARKASAEEIAGFVRAVGKVARDLDLVAPGYRLLANVGLHGGQEVPHLHVHLFGGQPLGPMLAR